MKRRYIILEKVQIITIGICTAIAIIIAGIIVSRKLPNKFPKASKIERRPGVVATSSPQEIKGRYIVWTGSFKSRGPDLAAVHKKMQEDMDKVINYLLDKGVNEKEIAFSRIYTETVHKKNKDGSYTNDVQEYRLIQSLRVRSNEFDKVIQVSKDSVELTKKGVEFVSDVPEYF